MGFPCGSVVKKPPANAGDMGSIPRSRRSPGEGNGNPFYYSCWEIPWTEEPGGLQSMGSQRIGHDWDTKQQQTSSCTAKLKGIDSWINIFHLRRVSSLDWSMERTTNFKWHPHPDRKKTKTVVDCWPKNPDQICKTYPTNSIELFTKCLSTVKIESYCFTSNHTVVPDVQDRRKIV